MLNQFQDVFKYFQKNEVRYKKDLISLKFASGREVDLEDVRILSIDDEKKKT